MGVKYLNVTCMKDACGECSNHQWHELTYAKSASVLRFVNPLKSRFALLFLEYREVLKRTCMARWQWSCLPASREYCRPDRC